LYALIVRGGDALILANDEGQAADDLDLAKKFVAANPNLSTELEILQKEIRRKDGRGSLKILPAKDIAGSHGKTAHLHELAGLLMRAKGTSYEDALDYLLHHRNGRALATSFKQHRDAGRVTHEKEIAMPISQIEKWF
jgi:hypothetical protein